MEIQLILTPAEGLKLRDCAQSIPTTHPKIFRRFTQQLVISCRRRRVLVRKKVWIRKTKARAVSPTKISEGDQRSNSGSNLSSLDDPAYVDLSLTSKNQNEDLLLPCSRAGDETPARWHEI